MFLFFQIQAWTKPAPIYQTFLNNEFLPHFFFVKKTRRFCLNLPLKWENVNNFDKSSQKFLKMTKHKTGIFHCKIGQNPTQENFDQGKNVKFSKIWFLYTILLIWGKISHFLIVYWRGKILNVFGLSLRPLKLIK